jgi:hypothetical protein
VTNATRKVLHTTAASVFALLMLAIPSAAQLPALTSEMPTTFRSDGCTGFPDGAYCDCCFEHDKDYFFGGSSKQRWRSDKRLYKCVKSKPGWHHKLIAPVMWLGVRIGGVGFLPTPFRWGFGRSKKLTVKPPYDPCKKKNMAPCQFSNSPPKPPS